MESGFVIAAEKRDYHLPPLVLDHRYILHVLDLFHHQCPHNALLEKAVSLERLLMLSRQQFYLKEANLQGCRVLQFHQDYNRLILYKLNPFPALRFLHPIQKV